MAGSCLPQRDGTRARPSRGSSEVRSGGILVCGKDASRLVPVLSSLHSVLCPIAAAMDALQTAFLVQKACMKFMPRNVLPRIRGKPSQHLVCGS